MVKRTLKIAVGVMMLACVLIGYLPQPQYLVELTCISNTLGGLLLIADGIFDLSSRKKFTAALYLNIAVCILFVFLVCAGSLSGAYRMNFRGAFFFLHVIDPIAFIICYMLSVNEHKRSIRCVLAAPVMAMAYLLFDCVRFLFTGEFVYGFIEPEQLTPVTAIVTGIVMYALFCLLGLLLFLLDRLLHKKPQEQ